jgi:hypothetical protein
MEDDRGAHPLQTRDSAVYKRTKERRITGIRSHSQIAQSNRMIPLAQAADKEL